ncbi:hypothetical protein GALMADRAFT_786996 [Galerina marginata CBS 339.88]|uniref:Inhibitor I9 domain-containing protein n=1 Tax=Galerina marginata (strain CBS 339.88) TaxID=685588 RepID=A0A067SN92_GALM3|nr:hypothetical protein GALMADRAFT_786996 [Galerina marginata CBS 339.88]
MIPLNNGLLCASTMVSRRQVLHCYFRRHLRITELSRPCLARLQLIPAKSTSISLSNVNITVDSKNIRHYKAPLASSYPNEEPWSTYIVKLKPGFHNDAIFKKIPPASWKIVEDLGETRGYEAFVGSFDEDVVTLLRELPEVDYVTTEHGEM